MSEDPARETVLVVCTANECRSPLAEALLRARHERWDVESAGLDATGRGATRDVVDAAQKAALDLRGHRSRHVRSLDLDRFDLIVTMTRRHVVELAVAAPEAFGRTVPIKDLVRLARSHPRRPDQSLRDWAEALVAHRSRAELLAGNDDTDVADPTGRGGGAHRKLVAELDALVTELVRLAGGTSAPV